MPAGTDYLFSATYSGDSNYTGSTSPTGSELLTINQGSTTLATAISGGGTGTLGASVYDTATITFTPTTTSFPQTQSGTVTYTFSGSELSGLAVPSGWTAVTSTEWQDTVNVTATGNVPNSAATGALPAGTDYLFSATYSGDSNYTGSTSPTNSELLTTSQGSTTLVTAISGGATGTLGASVYDTATITFTPTTTTFPQTQSGTVTYTFSGSELSGLTVASGWTAVTSSEWQDTVNVTATDTVPNSASTGDLPAGTDYLFSATYSGDSNYTGSTSPANSEPLTISKGGTTLATALTNGGTGTLGASVYDTATITFTPTTTTFPQTQSGTVTYTFSGSELSGLTVASGWTAVTSTEWQDTVNVTATGSVPNSAATGALPAGTDYLFSATYSGDSNYTGSTSPTGSEPLTISQGSTTLATAISDGGTGTLGASVCDTATITFSPATMSFAQSGTVTYTFTGSELSGLTVPSGWTAVTSTEWQDTVNVTATGTVPNSAATAALPAGTDYLFSATYSGDSNYTGSTSPANSEPLTISKGGTTLATALTNGGTGTLGASVYDTATITFSPTTPPFAVGGTVTYTFSGSELSGLTPASGWTSVTSTEWQDTANVTAAGTVPNSASTALPAGIDYAFSATYSGDSNYTGSTSPANSEPFTISKGGTTLATALTNGGTGTLRASVCDTATITFTPTTSFAQSGTVTYTFTGSELSSLTPASGWTACTSSEWQDTVNVHALAVCLTRPPPALSRPEPITPSPPRIAATVTTPVRPHRRAPNR